MPDDLLMRAEQSVLGILLAADTPPAVADQLTTDDFGHPVHRAVYTAIRDLEPLGYDTDRLTQAVTDLVDRPGVDPAWLRDLADHAPAVDLLPQYVQILVQAAFDRDVADFAAPYTAAADLAEDQPSRDALQRLARALDAQAAAFAPRTYPDGDIRLPGRDDAEPVTDLHRQDLVIADIVQHPEQGAEVARWLDPAVFTTEQRRLTFELAVSLAYDGDRFDAVTLAWHVQRSRDVAAYTHGGQRHDTDDHTYVQRLYAATVETGTAVVVGRDLLAEHIRATPAHHTTGNGARPVPGNTTHRIRQAGHEPPVTPIPGAGVRPIEL